MNLPFLLGTPLERPIPCVIAACVLVFAIAYGYRVGLRPNETGRDFETALHRAYGIYSLVTLPLLLFAAWMLDAMIGRRISYVAVGFAVAFCVFIFAMLVGAAWRGFRHRRP